jgi:cell division protein ZapE
MKKIILNEDQLAVKFKLDELRLNLENQGIATTFSRFFSFKKSTNSYKSYYIFGEVGRGKSMLMKDFYNSLSKTKKIYFHFNTFIRKLHETLHNIKKEEKQYKNNIFEAMRKILGDVKVLCLDEFQVLDIASAMMMEKIFSYFFKNQVIIILTSNEKPLSLYKQGLQREVFLDFIKNILLKNCAVLELKGENDYRDLFQKSLKQRYFIFCTKQFITKIIENFAPLKSLKPKQIKVWGREIKIEKSYKKTAVLDFDEIFHKEFSADDYQKIAEKFNLIFLLKLSELRSHDANEARRFILFVDEVYENKTALIIFSDIEVGKIFHTDLRLEGTTRAISRLIEIQTDSYWNQSKHS